MKTLTDEQRKDIVLYRIQNAQRTLAEVETLREFGFYNTAVNRMYYACFYAACAILIANGIETKSHEGVRLKLGQYFVLRGKLTPRQGRFYSKLFSKRSTGDYEDFINHTQETVDELLPDARLFVQTVQAMVDEWLAGQSD
ncbi:MAG: HEPN domain-containing protein [Bacteroidaceae bacterium]|nr:HEPN domain-containing protein [Bacteroidaceae bacterium]